MGAVRVLWGVSPPLPATTMRKPRATTVRAPTQDVQTPIVVNTTPPQGVMMAVAALEVLVTIHKHAIMSLDLPAIRVVCSPDVWTPRRPISTSMPIAKANARTKGAQMLLRVISIHWLKSLIQDPVRILAALH